jgi:hypothetical protein
MNEAFNKTPEYGASIEIPFTDPADKVIRVIALVGMIVLLLDLFIWRS